MVRGRGEVGEVSMTGCVVMEGNSAYGEKSKGKWGQGNDG